jgi:hypothetical protein
MEVNIHFQFRNNLPICFHCFESLFKTSDLNFEIYLNKRMSAVFRAGKWISYTPRAVIDTDPRITNGLRSLGAGAYATAIQKGLDGDVAHTIAEAIIFKRIYKDLEYDAALETLLKVAWE